MKKTSQFAALGAILGFLSAAPAFAVDDCSAQSTSLKEAITAKPADLLQLVEARVSASPACSCEIVKSAIESTQAEPKTVALIVEVASVAAPEQMRLIAQCAVAVAPDSLADVQSVLAKLDPSGGKGGSSAKDSKDSEDAKEPKVADTWNPLDFPGSDPNTPQATPTTVTNIPPGPPAGFPPIIENPASPQGLTQNKPKRPN